MKKSIDEIIDMLNENNDIEIQRQGIELGKQVKNFNVFLQPRSIKNSELLWKNCAKIICSKTSEELIPYLTNLLCWIKDLKTSGALKILNKLKEIKIERDRNYDFSWITELNNYIDIVKKIGDSKWLENLLEIKQFKVDKVQSVEELMEMLNENNDIEIQKQGIELGKQVKNFSIFIQPHFGKMPEQLWKNCAKIICSKKTEELIPHITELIWWSKDLNSPGALKITDKLKEINKEQSIIQELDRIIILLKKNDMNNLLELKKFLEVSK